MQLTHSDSHTVSGKQSYKESAHTRNILSKNFIKSLIATIVTLQNTGCTTSNAIDTSTSNFSKIQSKSSKFKNHQELLDHDKNNHITYFTKDHTFAPANHILNSSDYYPIVKNDPLMRGRDQIQSKMNNNPLLVGGSIELPKVLSHEKITRRISQEQLNNWEACNQELFEKHPIIEYLQNMSQSTWELNFSKAFKEKSEMKEALKNIFILLNKETCTIPINKIFTESNTINISLHTDELLETTDKNFFQQALDEVSEYYQKYVGVKLQRTEKEKSDMEIYPINGPVPTHALKTSLLGIYSPEQMLVNKIQGIVEATRVKIFIDARVPLVYKYNTTLDETSIISRVKAIIAHEIGHSFMMKHDTNPSALMSPELNNISKNGDYSNDTSLAIMKFLRIYFESKRELQKEMT